MGTSEIQLNLFYEIVSLAGKSNFNPKSIKKKNIYIDVVPKFPKVP